MACFLVSAAEATIVTVTSKVMEKKETAVSAEGHTTVGTECSHKIPFARKLKWLANLQWGGAALLAFEHVWHGEIVPWAPFLSAMADPADAAEMFSEMATTGVGMALLTTAVWGCMLAVVASMEKKAAKEEAETTV